MSRGKSLAGAAALALCAALAAAPVRADFRVWQPDAEPGEFALEHIGDYGYDRSAAKRGEQSYTGEAEYGVNNFWRTEVEAAWNRPPGTGYATSLTQFTTENVFQLTERGEYWADVGFYAEYGQSMQAGIANETTFGPILRKEFAGTINTVNLFIEKDIGEHASGRPAFLYAWQTRLALGTLIEPGFEAYGQPGSFGHFASMGGQDHRAGPQLYGTVLHLGPGTLVWNGGVLFGLTRAAPRETLRWQFEYEIHL